MKKHIKSKCAHILFAFGFLSISIPAMAQQDIQFSQYSFNGVSINPAYTGYKQDLMFNTFYRQQWTGIQGAPHSGGLTIDGTIDDDAKMGLGLDFQYDKTGPQTTVNAHVLYAYHIPLNLTTGEQVSFGIGGGFTQYGLDGTQFRYIDSGDPNINTQAVSAFIPDVKAGIQYFNQSFTAGLSVNNLLSIHSNQRVFYNDGLSTTTLGRSPQINFHAAYLANLSKEFKFKPEVLIMEDFKSPGSIDVNGSFLIGEKLWLGVGYRTGIRLFNKSELQSNLATSNAVSTIVQYEFNDFRVGYSYDISLSPLASYRGGTHELSLGIYFGDRHHKTQQRFF